MLTVSLSLLFLGVAPKEAPPPPPPAASYLYEPAACIDDLLRGSPRPYVPQPGDVVLSTDRSAIIRAGHFLAGSKGVHHSSLIYARPDGSPAVLEAGPFNCLRVKCVDPLELLHGHEKRGEKVWIRQRRVPLTPEQSCRLTEWAEAQKKCRFAAGRMMRQLTPFRCRGPWTEWVGGPQGQRSSYFCAELVMESCVAAGLVDPTYVRPTANYPRDFFFDRSSNRFLDAHPPLADGWCPPARWVSAVCGE